jgi:hypothetical protein
MAMSSFVMANIVLKSSIGEEPGFDACYPEDSSVASLS